MIRGTDYRRAQYQAQIGGIQRVHIAIAITSIDTRKRGVLGSIRVEEQSTWFPAGIAEVGGPIGQSLGQCARTPMDRAIREMFKKVRDAISAQMPKTYSHYPAGS